MSTKSIRLPDDCWLDILSQLCRPFVASQFSLVSRRFATLADSRLWTKRQKLPPLFVLCDRLGWVNGEQFVEKPMPICAPPKNLQLSSITMFICSCMNNALDFLLCLRHHKLNAFDFANIRMLKVPSLECQLLSDADFPQLLFWLHYCAPNDQQAVANKKQLHLFCDHLPGIQLVEAFIRLLIQVFSRSIDSCPYTIQFVLSNYDPTAASAFNNSLLFASVHYNFETGESLKLFTQLSLTDGEHGRGQQTIVMERTMIEKLSIDAKACEEKNELISAGRQKEECILIILK
uniref:F-box domain-containing protein n=1 Tax=Globodera rostochiensis TaxID=31243 RepID=A0A914H6Z1_GLORO